MAQGLGGGDRSKQGEKARCQHKSCSLGATGGWSHNGSVFPGGNFEIILAREPLSLQNKTEEKPGVKG